MSKKIDLTSLSEFNAAQFLTTSKGIKVYIQDVETENNTEFFKEAFKTVFMAKGAIAVADELGITVQQVWDAQVDPLKHPDIFTNMMNLFKKG